MRCFERRILVGVLLAGSAMLNVATVGYLAYTGGLRRALVRMNLLDVPPEREPFQQELDERYRKLPSRPGEVVFAGDSLIAGGPWADFYSAIHGRGIGGETTSGLLKRLDEVIEDRPRKVVLLVGANDLAAAVPPSRIIDNYRTILGRIRAGSPSTALVVVGVLPVNRTFRNGPIYTNTEVQEVNRRLRDLVEGFPNARFVDLTDLLVDEAGNLKLEYTTDGLHMRVEGYLAIRERLEGPVLESETKTETPPKESARP